MESKYTDVNINRMPVDFESVKINSSYGNHRIGIDAQASYRLDGYAKYCNINYPENNARVNRISQNHELEVNGIIGDNQDPESVVTVSSNYANVRLTR